MSQKETNFQPKSKKFGGGDKGRGRPAGRDTGKRFEGDRGDRPARGERSYARDGEKSYARPPRREGDDRPARKPYDRDGAKPYNRDSKPRYDSRDGGGDRKYGDKKPYEKKPYAGGGDRDRKPYDRDSTKPYNRDSKPRYDSRDGGGDRKPYEKKSYGDKKPYSKGGYEKKDSYDKRPRSYESRKPYDRDNKSRDHRRFDQADTAPQETSPQIASAETRQRLKSDRPGYGAPSSAYLYGAHAVRAALGNPRRLHQRLLVTASGLETIREAYEAAKADEQILPEPLIVEGVDIDRLLPRDAVHQGILLDSQPPEDIYLQDLLADTPEDAKILVLDQVTDPHNVGAILRSAAAFGAVAVVMQKLNAPDITGTLAKAASGAVEYVPMLREVNISRALEQLKEAGFFCIGLDERGKETVAKAAPKGGRVALVMGAEGDGLRRLVGESCDVLAKLPTGGPIASLNVSNAAAVALYELVRR